MFSYLIRLHARWWCCGGLRCCIASNAMSIAQIHKSDTMGLGCEYCQELCHKTLSIWTLFGPSLPKMACTLATGVVGDVMAVQIWLSLRQDKIAEAPFIRRATPAQVLLVDIPTDSDLLHDCSTMAEDFMARCKHQ